MISTIHLNIVFSAVEIGKIVLSHDSDLTNRQTDLVVLILDKQDLVFWIEVNEWSCFWNEWLKKILFVEDWIWFKYDYLHPLYLSGNLKRLQSCHKLSLGEFFIFIFWQVIKLKSYLFHFNRSIKIRKKIKNYKLGISRAPLEEALLMM